MKATYLRAASSAKDYPLADQPEIAVVGRSNVGKSSFINRFLQQQGLARVSKTPGRTQLIHFFNTDSGFRLVDLPGYGFAKVPAKVRMAWRPMIEEYLLGRESLKLTICLIDIRHPASHEDVDLKAWLDQNGKTACLVATKSDKLSSNERIANLKALRQQFGSPEPIPSFSSVTGQGRDEIMRIIHSLIPQK